MEILKKEQIAEYLRTYFLFMQNARMDRSKNLKEVFIKLIKQIYPDNNPREYYVQMLNTYLLFSLISVIGSIKDEYLMFLKRDNNINQKFSFLDSCFVNGSNPSDYNKVDVIMYIRNAFFHSENKDLYSINSDGTVNIHMPGINLYLKLSKEILLLISQRVADYTNRAVTYKIKNQDKINIDNMLKSKESCIKELKKINIIRIQNKNKSSKTRKDVVLNLPKNKQAKKIENIEKYFLDFQKNVEIFDFSLSIEQCESIATQIGLYKEFITLDIFLASLIFNNLEFGILKASKTIFEYFINEEFVYNWDNTIERIYDIVSNDFCCFVIDKDINPNNFFRRNFYDFGTLNGDFYKNLYIYMLELIQFPYNSLSFYLTYVYSNIVSFDTGSEKEKIRNSLTHKRYFWCRRKIVSNSEICLYDNVDDIRKPVSYDKASWKKKINILEIMKMADCFVHEYCDKQKIIKK